MEQVRPRQIPRKVSPVTDEASILSAAQRIPNWVSGSRSPGTKWTLNALESRLLGGASSGQGPEWTPGSEPNNPGDIDFHMLRV